jgi:hypothetical protein
LILGGLRKPITDRQAERRSLGIQVRRLELPLLRESIFAMSSCSQFDIQASQHFGTRSRHGRLGGDFSLLGLVYLGADLVELFR